MFLSSVIILSGIFASASVDTLSAAAVTADRGVTVSRTDTVVFDRGAAMPDVGETLLAIPGLLLGDNGGLAGLKTVSLRGLGSPHTSVCIDGLRVGNVQSGQTDLGMIGLEDCGGVVVDYAQNSINFTTRRPVFGDSPFAGSAGVDAGSFGTWLPRVRMDFRLPGSCSLSAHAAGVVSRGDFAFGGGLARENNDIRQFRGGADLFGVTGGGDWVVKTCLNASERGVPGSADWPSTDRQSDRNFLIQGVMRHAFDARNSTNLSAKLSRDRILYKSEWSDSDGVQTELQLNVSHRFKAGRHCNLSASAGVVRDLLHSTEYEASRTSLTGTAGASFRTGGFRADASLVYDGTFDAVGGHGSLVSNTLSPSLDVRQKLFRGFDVTGFARRAYRTPTFNELYYPGYGNPELAPEDAWLLDVGADWRGRLHHGLSLKAKVDAFLNHVKDKITSAPTVEDPSVWMPYNIGEVLVKGVDADMNLDFASGGMNAALGARYSFQHAGDVPYVSRHSAVMTADFSLSGWSAGAVWNLRAGRRDSYGEMPDWNTLDLTAARRMNLGGLGTAILRLTCRNVSDMRYSLVSGYPMPGRSLLAGLSINF